MMQVAMRLGVSLRSIEGYTSGRSFPLSQFWRGVVANYAPSSAVLGKLLQEILENDNRNDRQA